ncbi:hypothetical protein [Streptomyces ortus]|uniref:Helix-turn-helix domain-containing protein n=1 Tax=Streptomyces ortus TaxID=2867268 RepID=A0ABT3UZE0_9ACTN|nr:hypothetical protein [Streptomyces ortus]MCX4232818.1 hypothetical protein [Streptomyces ortus]
MAANPSAHKPQAVIAEEAVRAYEMQLSGMSVRRIAKELHIAIGTVDKRIKTAIAAVIVPTVEELRTREGDRLLYLLDRLQPAVDRGDVGAIKTAARLSESYRKLFGLNAPEQHTVQLHEVTQIDLGVQEMIRDARARAQLNAERT